MAHSANLISTDDLARQLGAPALRVFDCTTYLKPGPDGRYIAESGRANYDKGHIPGAAYLDLQADLSDKSSKLRFTLPSLEELTKAFAAKGVGHGTFVVLYSHASPVWASRIWWMLRAVGFDEVAILDGGLDKWKAEGRPLSTEAATHPPATLSLRGRPEIFVDKDAIKGAIGDSGDTDPQCAQPRPAHRRRRRGLRPRRAASRVRPACRPPACSGRTRR